jgi:threonine/homoserine/homoserine lactone efflux protein
VINGYVDLTPLPLFLVAVAVICLAPGPDMIYMIGTGLAGGRSAATRRALGITLGVSVYVLAAAAGLGAAVSRFPEALALVQVLGAGYLAWLAYQTFTGAAAAPEAPAASSAGDRRWFRRGVIVDLTNPKILLFFVAFLPQFLGSAPSPTAQLLLLGGLFQAVGLVIDLGVGWAAGSFRARVLARPRLRRRLDVVSGVVFAALATLVLVQTAAELA